MNFIFYLAIWLVHVTAADCAAGRGRGGGGAVPRDAVTASWCATETPLAQKMAELENICRNHTLCDEVYPVGQFERLVDLVVPFQFFEEPLGPACASNYPSIIAKELAFWVHRSKPICRDKERLAIRQNTLVCVCPDGAGDCGNPGPFYNEPLIACCMLAIFLLMIHIYQMRAHGCTVEKKLAGIRTRTQYEGFVSKVFRNK